jgi:subtilisin family serine protease
MNYIIEFVESMTSQEIDQYLFDHTMTEETTFTHFTSVRVVSCKQVPAIDQFVISAILDDAPGIKLLEYTQDFTVDYTMDEFSTTDEKNWWKMSSIKSPEYDEPTEHHQRRGTKTSVYVLDSGIELTHPEFVDANITLLHSFTGEFSDNRGHGTALASLIVGKTCGLTDSHLKVVKIFDKKVATKQSDLLAALDAVMVDFKVTAKPAVVNLSWNIAKNQYLEDKLNAMMLQGIYIVAAAGNDGQAITDVTPASVPLAQTIGAYNKEFEPCNFTNYTGSDLSITTKPTNSGELDGWAPGELIYAATLDGTYGMIAGTSASAAIHSGALAYNLELVLDADGNFGHSRYHTNQLTSGADYLSLARDSMMVLDGVYSASTNKITTYFTHQGDRPTPPGGQAVYVVGKKAEMLLFDTLNVKSIKYDTALPSGLYISNGYIGGTPDDIESDYTITKIDITLTMQNDVNQMYNLVIVITKADYDVYDQPIDDPDVQFIIAVPACCAIINKRCVSGSNCSTFCYEDYVGKEVVVCNDCGGSDSGGDIKC